MNLLLCFMVWSCLLAFYTSNEWRRTVERDACFVLKGCDEFVFRKHHK